MDIEQIRDQMPGLRFGVYLNTGGIGQAPVSVNKAMADGYQQMLSGSVSTIDWYTEMERAASEMPARIAGFFGADGGEIALTMSTGEGYGMVLGGLSWQPGDEVIITNEEHPVPLQAAEGLADRAGAVIKVVEIDQDKDVFLNRLEDAITPRTRLFCFSHVHPGRTNRQYPPACADRDGYHRVGSGLCDSSSELFHAEYVPGGRTSCKDSSFFVCGRAGANGYDRRRWTMALRRVGVSSIQRFR